MTYEETMRWGEAQYADAIKCLQDAGLPASFTQTGGMCAAIFVQLEAGRSLLITDADDTLSWAREEHRGWGVGLYMVEGDDELAIRYLETDDGTVTGLLRVVGEVMGAVLGPASVSIR